jgi:hypothetical protein
MLAVGTSVPKALQFQRIFEHVSAREESISRKRSSVATVFCSSLPKLRKITGNVLCPWLAQHRFSIVPFWVGPVGLEGQARASVPRGSTWRAGPANCPPVAKNRQPAALMQPHLHFDGATGSMAADRTSIGPGGTRGVDRAAKIKAKVRLVCCTGSAPRSNGNF